MEYGVIVYKDTLNIGDDIQSYAAAQLLPRVDYYIEREHLDVFRPKEQEPVNVIMNGWFMYDKMGWPISPCINPLYISMHFWENDALGIENSFLEGVGSEDLKEHQPIGCRDKETQEFLERSGVKTWFSGCVTLTLRAKYPQNKQKYVCLVDVNEETESYVRKKYPDIDFRIIHHEENGIVDPEASWQERFINVEALLELYQNAMAVVTTRLHCALPCLALETPVLLLSDSEIAEQGRFEGLYSLLHTGTTIDFINGKLEYDLNNPGKNSKKYVKLRENITSQVSAFLEKNNVCTKALRARFETYDQDWERRALWKDIQLTKLMHKAIEIWNQRHASQEELQQGKDWLEQQYCNLQTEIKRLNNEAKKLNNEIQEIRTANMALENEKVELMLEKQHLTNEKLELQDKNIDLDILNASLRCKNKVLREKAEYYSRQCDIYYHTIEDMKSSFSWKVGWRMTAIPRKIVGLIRK